ncbi:ABC transporter substrate-binding protein [Cohnella sp. WQ 127256]|uniref:ABC transporter substrate-binding protein n=1 Tax=Cohnella sp. WQ 127256 TaxID=2938790 RepID=UPI002117D60A|nr:ABC transporter substrate-binding protein [Cohnella sp. WQ 127256]
MKITKFWMGLCLSVSLIGLTACSSGNGGGNNAVEGTNAPETGKTGGAVSTEQAKAPGNSPSKGEKATIVFSTFWPDDTFKEAKKKYEAKHPNITIELHDVQADDAHTEAELEKYVTSTNAAMLSGKGPDILLLDMLPSEKYVGQHLLADLSDKLKQDPSFKNGEYFNNILENSQTSGGLYGIPLNFFLNVLLGDEAAIKQAGVPIDDKTWTWEKLAETTKQLAQKGPYTSALGTSPEYLLGEMVKENHTRFVDEENRKASFDTAAFTDMMQQVKTMKEDGIIAEGRFDTYFAPRNINSSWDYLVSLKEFGEQAKLYAKPQAEGTKAGGYFYTYKTIGINEKSAVKEEAWEFLQFLMSEELQISPERAGFPINKKVYEKQVQKLLSDGTFKTYEEGPLQGQSFPVDKQLLQQLESYLTEAVHPGTFQKSKIEEIVTKECKAFFSGQKTAQEVAKLIQNKVMTYLNE